MKKLIKSIILSALLGYGIMLIICVMSSLRYGENLTGISNFVLVGGTIESILIFIIIFFFTNFGGVNK